MNVKIFVTKLAFCVLETNTYLTYDITLGKEEKVGASEVELELECNQLGMEGLGRAGPFEGVNNFVVVTDCCTLTHWMLLHSSVLFLSQTAAPGRTGPLSKTDKSNRSLL